MQVLDRRSLMFGVAALLAGCGQSNRSMPFRADDAGASLNPNETAELHHLINKYSDIYQVPRPLIHRVVKRESTYNPKARNGPYYGLMQILPQTARGMGYSGAPAGLLDADTNLKYGVKYLRGAWLVSDGDPDRAVGWYSRGYYYEAKRRGLLVQTGLRSA